MVMNFLKDLGFKGLKWSVIKIAGLSYWVALIICIVSVLFYAVGIKKGEKVALGSFITFLLLQALKGAL